MDGMRFGHALLPLWDLEPGMAFLNHGSYGATPREVAAEAQNWRARMERQPVRFFADELPGALRDAATVLARFVGCAPERLGFVENASSGTNAVLGSIPFAAGDEVLSTTHGYNAVRNNLRHLATTSGIVPVEAPVPFPIASEDAALRAIEESITPRTRLILVDHVTSASALILPIAQIVALARQHCIAVLIDGAHGPGMVDLDVDAIGADWYVGNCHKWLCAPKGAGFIAVSPSPAFEVHPTVISHAYAQGFTAEFDRIGTRDCSAWLAVPAAVALHERLGGASLRERNRDLACRMAANLAEALGTGLGGPASITGSIATVRLPWTGPAETLVGHALRRRLWQEDRVELPVMALGGALWARLSAAPYNEEADYAGLADVLRRCLRRAQDQDA